MKRHWAVLLAAVMLAGCRSSQPATNPFLRTTVPPPGTGEGLMVMPGEPMAAPPVVTTPVPPAVSPAVPVTPGPQAPLMAPPPVTPQQEEFHPPGGSYLYHQSSNERPVDDAVGGQSPVKLASAEEPQSAPLEFQAAPSIPAVHQAAYQSEPIALSTGAARQDSSLKFQQTDASSRGDPPERSVASSPPPPAGSSAIRIVGGSDSKIASNTSSPAESSVLRITAGEPVSTQTQSWSDTASGGTSHVAIVTPTAASQMPASTTRPKSAVTQTAFQTVAASDYSHTPDYGALRGRLEYSQRSHQWKLRYIPINGRPDAHGGSVMLEDAPSLQSYGPGDMVAVRGRMASESGSAGIVPSYQIDSIEPLAR